MRKIEYCGVLDINVLFYPKNFVRQKNNAAVTGDANVDADAEVLMRDFQMALLFFFFLDLLFWSPKKSMVGGIEYRFLNSKLHFRCLTGYWIHLCIMLKHFPTMFLCLFINHTTKIWCHSRWDTISRNYTLFFLIEIRHMLTRNL